jgi:hypothetical protein
MRIKKLLAILLFFGVLFPLQAQVIIDKSESLSYDTLTVDINVDGFTRISAFQMGFTFDTFGLQFINATFADLPAFNSSNLNIADDLISVLWLENEIAGETLTDGTTLISLKFKVIHPFYGPVQLSNCPLELEFFDISLNEVLVETDILNDSRCPAISGRVFLDLAYDCNYNDGSDQPAEGVCLKVQSPIGVSYVCTDKDGNFRVQGPNGNYIIEMIPPDAYWNPCDTILELLVAGAPRIVSLGLQAAYPCPMMQVNIPDSYLSGCDAHSIQIDYRNIGTIPVNAAQITVGLDSGFQILSADLPYTEDSGKYIFEVPVALNPLQSGSFGIQVQPDCELLDTGKEFCVTTSVSPAAFCRPPGQGWDGSNLSLTGTCLDSIATFRIENGGSDMTAEASVFIFRNEKVVERRNIQLMSFANEIIEVESQGTRVSVLVAQPQGFAYQGFLYTSIDNCDGMSSGAEHPFSPGDPLPFNVISCIQYNPQLQGEKLWTTYTPPGYGEDHKIQREMQISVSHKLALPAGSGSKKLILTSNIDPNIDLESLQFGGVEFPYTMNLSGRDLTMRLYPNAGQDTIYLSYSYLADQATPPGTDIENTVNFFLSDGSQVGSNIVHHQIDTMFLEAELSTVNPSAALPGVKVFPNPAADMVHIEWDQSAANAILVDMYGKTIVRTVVNQGMNELGLYSIPSGVYFLHMNDVKTGKPVAVQKIVKK